MPEVIEEAVSVDLVSSHTKGTAQPYVLSWRGRRYIVSQVGLHSTTRVGRVLYHIFSVTDGASSFRLLFDTETLGWTLLEIDG